MKKIVLILLLAFSTSCTAAQWQAFQASNALLASYVSDAMLAVHIIENIVGGRSAENQDVFEAIDAANEVLQVEANVVRDSHSPLDTPAQIAAAFPRFIVAWNHLAEAFSGHHVGTRVGGPHIVAPAIVRVVSHE